MGIVWTIRAFAFENVSLFEYGKLPRSIDLYTIPLYSLFIIIFFKGNKVKVKLIKRKHKNVLIFFFLFRDTTLVFLSLACPKACFISST